jgi:hypothetical protein
LIWNIFSPPRATVRGGVAPRGRAHRRGMMQTHGYCGPPCVPCLPRAAAGSCGA